MKDQPEGLLELVCSVQIGIIILDEFDLVGLIFGTVFRVVSKGMFGTLYSFGPVLQLVQDLLMLRSKLFLSRAPLLFWKGTSREAETPIVLPGKREYPASAYWDDRTVALLPVPLPQLRAATLVFPFVQFP